MADRVLVAGGGIGGLTAALTLAEAGIPVTVFEAVRSIEALGVGINLLPHSVRVLDRLGLLGELRSIAIETAKLAYYNRHGQLVWEEPRGIEAGYPVPQLSIHRGSLQQVLVRAVENRLGADAVRTGARLMEFSDQGGRLVARFEDRQRGGTFETEGAVLVGADGIHSTVRAALFPGQGPPRHSGRILWRAISETGPFLGGRTMVMAGHQRQKFVCYPISGDHLGRGRSLTNWIAELEVGGPAPSRQDWSRVVPASVFAGAFDGWRFPWLDVPAVIGGASEIFEYPMVDRDPLPQWSFGRITLLGDAAHPMYPVGSNGASQAILDADALAGCLAAGPDVEVALRRYQEARLPPTTAVVHANRRNGPEQVMQLAEDRAPDGFDDIERVIPRSELEAIASRYKQTAGFSHEQVDRRTGRG